MKKNMCLFMCFLAHILIAKSPVAWINEIHYDNVGTDCLEFVEVVVINPENYYLGDLALYMYNGYNGCCYCLDTIDEFQLGTRIDQYQFYVWYQRGIQNDTEGMQLVFRDTTLDILAYEGSFVGATPPGIGLVFPDIHVCEDGSGCETNSIYLTGNPGSEWTYGVATPGELNVGQIFSESSTAVDLLYFKCKHLENSYTLFWESANEVECLYYNLYKNGLKIAKITACGTSSGSHMYEWIDNTPWLKGTNVFVLSEVDFSANENYLDTIYFAYHPKQMNILGTPFPNPFNPKSRIPIHLEKPEKIELALLDLSGHKIQEIWNGVLLSGEHDITITCEHLSSGKYILYCKYGEHYETKPLILLK